MPTDPEKQYGVPRRFGIRTILVVTSAFAVLFAMLTAMGTPPVVVVSLTSFFVLIGIAQIWMFGGNEPRAASYVAGAAGLPIIVVAMGIYSGDVSSHFLVQSLICCVFAGPFLGYFVGLLVAGVFLIMDSVEKTFFSTLGKVVDAEVASETDDPLADD